jgi:hypothetical protein
MMTELALKMVYTFLVMSLVASAGTEAISSISKWRADMLLRGMKAMLNDPNFTGLAREIYNHPLINPRATGTATMEAQLRTRPSYIEPRFFATALVEICGLAQGDSIETLEDKIRNKVADKQLQDTLFAGIRRAKGNLDQFQAELIEWFNFASDRIKGSYTRRTQLSNFLIALVLSVIFNVMPFPIAPQTDGHGPSFVWVFILLGWLVTAVSTLFGAAFWFGLLQKITNVKGAGAAPDKSGTPSATPSASPAAATPVATQPDQEIQRLAADLKAERERTDDLQQKLVDVMMDSARAGAERDAIKAEIQRLSNLIDRLIDRGASRPGATE